MYRTPSQRIRGTVAALTTGLLALALVPLAGAPAQAAGETERFTVQFQVLDPSIRVDRYFGFSTTNPPTSSHPMDWDHPYGGQDITTFLVREDLGPSFVEFRAGDHFVDSIKVNMTPNGVGKPGTITCGGLDYSPNYECIVEGTTVTIRQKSQTIRISYPDFDASPWVLDSASSNVVFNAKREEFRVLVGETGYVVLRDSAGTRQRIDVTAGNIGTPVPTLSCTGPYPCEPRHWDDDWYTDMVVIYPQFALFDVSLPADTSTVSSLSGSSRATYADGRALSPGDVVSGVLHLRVSNLPGSSSLQFAAPFGPVVVRVDPHPNYQEHGSPTVSCVTPASAYLCSTSTRTWTANASATVRDLRYQLAFDTDATLKVFSQNATPLQTLDGGAIAPNLAIAPRSALQVRYPALGAGMTVVDEFGQKLGISLGSDGLPTCDVANAPTYRCTTSGTTTTISNTFNRYEVNVPASAGLTITDWDKRYVAKKAAASTPQKYLYDVADVRPGTQPSSWVTWSDAAGNTAKVSMGAAGAMRCDTLTLSCIENGSSVTLGNEATRFTVQTTVGQDLTVSSANPIRVPREPDGSAPVAGSVIAANSTHTYDVLRVSGASSDITYVDALGERLTVTMAFAEQGATPTIACIQPSPGFTCAVSGTTVTITQPQRFNIAFDNSAPITVQSITAHTIVPGGAALAAGYVASPNSSLRLDVPNGGSSMMLRDSYGNAFRVSLQAGSAPSCDLTGTTAYRCIASGTGLRIVDAKTRYYVTVAVPQQLVYTDYDLVLAPRLWTGSVPTLRAPVPTQVSFDAPAAGASSVSMSDASGKTVKVVFGADKVPNCVTVAFSCAIDGRDITINPAG